MENFRMGLNAMGQRNQTNRQKDISRVLRDKNRQQKNRAGKFPGKQNRNTKNEGGRHG